MPFITSSILFLTRSLYSGGIVRNISQAAVLSSSKSRPSTESLIQWNKLPIPKKPRKDRWSEKRALFGENDYKDILGDGSYPLKYNVRVGPKWMHGWRGNELQMLIRKNKVVGADMGPTKHYAMLKRIKFLLKRMNRNKGTGQYKDKYVPNYRDRM